MRRTKKWWASLKRYERDYLVFAEKAEKSFSLYSSVYLPDGCSECRICGEPGECGCLDEMMRIINKADSSVIRATALKERVVALKAAAKAEVE